MIGCDPKESMLVVNVAFDVPLRSITGAWPIDMPLSKNSTCSGIAIVDIGTLGLMIASNCTLLPWAAGLVELASRARFVVVAVAPLALVITVCSGLAFVAVVAFASTGRDAGAIENGGNRRRQKLAGFEAFDGHEPGTCGACDASPKGTENQGKGDYPRRSHQPLDVCGMRENLSNLGQTAAAYSNGGKRQNLSWGLLKISRPKYMARFKADQFYCGDERNGPCSMGRFTKPFDRLADKLSLHHV